MIFVILKKNHAVMLRNWVQLIKYNVKQLLSFQTLPAGQSQPSFLLCRSFIRNKIIHGKQV
jgi:hypothetical protein